jgi:hypothetical protein
MSEVRKVNECIQDMSPNDLREEITLDKYMCRKGKHLNRNIVWECGQDLFRSG